MTRVGVKPIDDDSGPIGDHLRILLDAGLAERHRSGVHVLYRRTPTGQQLIGHPDPVGSARHLRDWPT